MPTITDFPITRKTLEQLDGWVMAFVSPLLPPEQVAVDLPHASGVQWRFREETERVLLAGKAIRVASGIRVAFMLADLGYIAECGTILRTVSDFSNEIIAICEGCSKSAPTSAQKKFVTQYFTPLPADPDEYDREEKERWVARDDLIKAHIRWAIFALGADSQAAVSAQVVEPPSPETAPERLS